MVKNENVVAPVDQGFTHHIINFKGNTMLIRKSGKSMESVMEAVFDIVCQDDADQMCFYS